MNAVKYAGKVQVEKAQTFATNPMEADQISQLKV